MHRILETFLVIITTVFSFSNASSQQFSEERILNSGTLGVRVVTAGDVNNDGFTDIISANQWANEISLIINLDGQNFDQANAITGLNEPISLTLADLNNDGNLDIISGSPTDPSIVWLENEDGDGNFSSPILISTASNVVNTIVPADLNNDGMVDLITSSDGSGIEWHKNEDNGANFVVNILIENILARSIAVGDLDNDGDLDIVSGSTGSALIFWYENLDGLGNYGEKQIIENQGTFHTTFALYDMNGDDKLDILVGVDAAGEISWYENLNNDGTFSEKQIITSEADGVLDAKASDLDNDGDLDVISASDIDDKVSWYENIDGLGTFGQQQVINTTDARSILAVDLDNDGDMDVVSGSRNDSKVAWYENLEILSVDSNILDGLTLYPNPTESIIKIKTPSAVNINEAILRDLNGREILSVQQDNIDQIQFETMTAGVYFVTLKTVTSIVTKKIVIK